MNETSPNLGKQIKEYRLSREMTAVQASALFRISLATLSRIENGRAFSDMTRSKILKILVPEALHGVSATVERKSA